MTAIKIDSIWFTANISPLLVNWERGGGFVLNYSFFYKVPGKDNKMITDTWLICQTLMNKTGGEVKKEKINDQVFLALHKTNKPYARRYVNVYIQSTPPRNPLCASAYFVAKLSKHTSCMYGTWLGWQQEASMEHIWKIKGKELYWRPI